MFEPVAPGVGRLGILFVNVLALGEPGGPWLLVDAGLPGSAGVIRRAVARRFGTGARPEAILLTHGHFDHVGFAERARSELGVPVYVHENDVPLTQHPWRYDHERPRSPYLLTQVRALPIVAALVRNRAMFPAPVKQVARFEDGTLPVPGSPRVVFSPGHTYGHCALHLPDRDVLIAGDAIVMLDPYTGEKGPQIVAGAATANVDLALESVGALEETGASTVLTGHGPPWRDGVAEAARRARAIGAH